MKTNWRDTRVIAWTESDGPGRPPAGTSPRVLFTLAGVLGVTMAGVLATDALCPDHRAWVHSLAGTAMLGSIAAVVALLRGSPSATWLTLLVAAAGSLIGVIDAVHDPRRGVLIACGFGLVVLFAAVLLVRDTRLRRWDRAVDAQVAAEPWLAAGPARTVPADARHVATGDDRRTDDRVGA